MTKRTLPKGIRLTKSGKFSVDVSSNGTRRTKTCETMDEARRIQFELKGVILENQGSSNFIEPVRSSWTIKQACDYMFETKWKSAINMANCKSKEAAILGYFGTDALITSITTHVVNDFVSHLYKKNLAAGTVQLYLMGLSTVLHVMLDIGELEKLPKFPPIKNTAKRIKFFSHEEEVKILDYFVGRVNVYDAIVCLLDTGLRCNELLKLQTKDVDFGTNLITIWKTKTNKPRSIPMTSRVAEILTRRSGLRIKGRLFEFNYSVLSWHWGKMARAVFPAEKNIVLHVLRHTCCSRLIQGGAPLTSVMVWLGHTNIQTTMIYSHLAPDALTFLLPLLQK